MAYGVRKALGAVIVVVVVGKTHRLDAARCKNFRERRPAAKSILLVRALPALGERPLQVHDGEVVLFEHALDVAEEIRGVPHRVVLVVEGVDAEVLVGSQGAVPRRADSQRHRLRLRRFLQRPLPACLRAAGACVASHLRRAVRAPACRKGETAHGQNHRKAAGRHYPLSSHWDPPSLPTTHRPKPACLPACLCSRKQYRQSARVRHPKAGAPCGRARHLQPCHAQRRARA